MSYQRMNKTFQLSALSAAILLCSSLPAHAFQFDTDNADLRIRLDTNVKYNAAWRVQDQKNRLISDMTLDDGDRNFDKGSMINNRVDLFSEFDVNYRGMGVRVSGAAWYDRVYNRKNDHDNPETSNNLSVAYNEFTKETRDLHGRDAELRDAFVYSDFSLTDDVWGVVRVGQHSLLYGESLFFGNNGIAGGMMPINAIQALSAPNSQFKELVLPVKQISGDLQLTPALSLGAYYQFEWERTRIPAAGSYFSPADLLDGGGERILAAPGVSLYRTKDIEARDSGQWGFQLRYRADSIDTDFGLYAINYHDKNFQVQTRPFDVPQPGVADDIVVGEHMLVFPEDVRAYGFSATTGIGDANVAFEGSIRRNAPLVSLTVNDITGDHDNDRNPLYAVGNTAHAQVSMIQIMPQSRFWDTAALMGEVAWNRTLSVTKNREWMDPNSTRDATAMRVVFNPTYFQVFDGIDLSVPMGVSYGIDGRSSAVGGFSQAKGGGFNIGLSAEYLKRVTVALSYNGFYGPTDRTSSPEYVPAVDATTGVKSYKQTNGDRDFISLNASYTF
ncbi:DUF1302 domain-containing protein [Pseudomonas sp. MYb185]|uniref:DUF1302 domain-containing protein n=1 Tax=Pseudomonas sp. MYb185 TaxID=1848729 RepID=UPI001C44C217|nr:DUF1302 domain-containing protein [Pseudomonas sp. MYb185]